MVSNRKTNKTNHPIWTLVAPLVLFLFTACSATANPVTTATQAAGSNTSATQAVPTEAPAELAETGGTQPVATEPAVQATQAVTAALEPAATDPNSPAFTCIAPAEQTPAMTEGPYFKTGSPERSSLLEEGMAGTQLTITGYVLTTDCQPVANALLEFWQADAQGNYDNAGYRLRGHVFTDAEGRYQITTVVPGEYPGRTEHIHVKVQAPGGPVLTTQVFFPGVQGNQTDRIFSDKLLLDLQNTQEGAQGTYNFVVPTG